MKGVIPSTTPEMKWSDADKLWQLDSTCPSGLRWRAGFSSGNPTLKRYEGKPAGTILVDSNALSYWVVRYAGKGYKAHRIVYMLSMMKDLDKSQLIDHEDGDGLNNSHDNLRLVTSKLNARNARKNVKNSTGYAGVSIQWSQPGHEGIKYHRASYRDDNGNVRCKLFRCEEDEAISLSLAVEWRDKMIKQIGGYTSRHGKEG